MTRRAAASSSRHGAVCMGLRNARRNVPARDHLPNFVCAAALSAFDRLASDWRWQMQRDPVGRRPPRNTSTQTPILSLCARAASNLAGSRLRRANGIVSAA
jgi:hypothetical protein